MKMGYVQVVVYSKDELWDCLHVFLDRLNVAIVNSNRHQSLANGDFNCDSDFEIVESSHFLSDDGDKLSLKKRYKFPVTLNGHELSYFAYLLRISKIYRWYVIRYWHSRLPKHVPVCRSVKIYISVIDPPQQVIDYSWNFRITYMISERSELDTAMSWLSTLGGAYSALGDHFTYCAKMAGRISLQQFKIALRLGDVNTVARCKLFIALSMLQMKRFRQARHLVEEQYRIACDSSCQDIRLIRMCRGVWSKLRYEHSKYIMWKKKLKT